MCLQRERPFGVGEAILNGFGREAGVFGGVACVAGLEIAVARLDVGILGNRTAVINHFQFVAVGEQRLGGTASREVSIFGGESDPIQIVGNAVRTVGFNRDVVASSMELVNEIAGDEERGFASCEHHLACGERVDGGEYFLLAHQLVSLVLGVAEGATQVTTREADENARRTCVETFPLEGIENFVDGEHGIDWENGQDATNRCRGEMQITAQRFEK